MRWNLDENPDLTPDLEWMLQSGQASRALLAEALADEFYPSVYTLALVFLGDEKAARAAALRTFQAALSNSDRYRPAFGVKPWFYRQVVISFRWAGWRTWGIPRLHMVAKPAILNSKEEKHSPAQLDDDLLEAVRALPGPLRMVVLLRSLAGLEEREIAWVLGQAEEQVRDRLDTAWQGLQTGLGPPEVTPEERTELALSRKLASRWPPRPVAPLERRQLLAALARRENHRYRMAPLGNLLWIGLAILAAAGFAWGSRPAAPRKQVPPLPINTPTPLLTQAPDGSVSYNAQPGETLLSISATTGVPIAALLHLNDYPPDEVFKRGRQVRLPAPPFPQAPTPVPPLSDGRGPLTARSKPSSLQERLTTGQPPWQTLWVDAQFIKYGPPGYVGPPRTFRSQVWISLPDQSIQLIGPVRGEPDYRFLIEGSYIYFFSQERNDSWYSETPELLVSWSALPGLIFPGRAEWLHEPGVFQIVGEEESAGRTAIVADWKDLSGRRLKRLWVDAQTGIILHQRDFGGADQQVVTADFLITAITYNASFPPELFDPRESRLEYVQDYLGLPLSSRKILQLPAFTAPEQRQTLQRQPAPTGFDPAKSPLAFQYPEDLTVSDSTPLVDLFAGRFYLGRIPFVDPWNMLCTRSPDGRRIAFTLKPGRQQSGRTPAAGVQWFDLGDLEIHSLPGLMEAANFAFAPDSQRLAVFGYMAGSRPGIDVVDIGTVQVTRLINLDHAESLVWSPNGRYLGLVGRRPGGSGLEVMVLLVNSGRTVYSAPVDSQVYQQVLAYPGLNPEWPASDWPGHAWDARFPVRMGELGACAAPPE